MDHTLFWLNVLNSWNDLNNTDLLARRFQSFKQFKSSNPFYFATISLAKLRTFAATGRIA